MSEQGTKLTHPEHRNQIILYSCYVTYCARVKPELADPKEDSPLLSSTTEHGGGSMDWPLHSFWKLGTEKGHDSMLCVPYSCECFAFWFTAVSRWEAYACTVQKHAADALGFAEEHLPQLKNPSAWESRDLTVFTSSS